MLAGFALVLRLCLITALRTALALLRSTGPSSGADGGI